MRFSRDKTILILSSISLFEVIKVFSPSYIIFNIYPASADYAVAVNPNSIKRLWSNSVCIFFVNDQPAFSDGPRTLPRNPPENTILHSCVFGFLADELCAKALQRLETYLLVNKNSFGKLD